MGGVAEVRGRGLMLGVGLPGENAAELRDGLLAEGLIVNAPDPSTIRLLPPLILSEAEVDEGLELMRRALG